MQRIAVLLSCILLCLLTNHAQAAEKDSLSLSQLLSVREPTPCAAPCYTIQRLKLTGSVAQARSVGVSFELDGALLHPEGFASLPNKETNERSTSRVRVKLFGAVDKVQLKNVTENGAPAVVGFSDSHYFIFTRTPVFSIKGQIIFSSDLALSVAGPVNTLESEFSTGSLVEGNRLTGVQNTVIHFDAGEAKKSAQEATVFQLSKAIRVQREISFEYRLVLRSGADLGVVKLPIRSGEKVLDVKGSTGWRVEGTDLILPTSGNSASIQVVGKLKDTSLEFAADDRSSYEWLLVENDPEHRVTVGGDAKQLDVSQSPIARTQSSSRLYLLTKGQKLTTRVENLFTVGTLATVISHHKRFAVLTSRGDLVSDESISYENNGLDHLEFHPVGRPIFQATDGAAEHVLRRNENSDELLLALRKGNHQVRLQSMSKAQLDSWIGRFEFQSPSHTLPTSRGHVTIALPSNIIPIVLLGGERPDWAFGANEIFGVLVSLLFSIFVGKTYFHRSLLAIVMVGFWFAVPAVNIVGYCAFIGYLLVKLLRASIRHFKLPNWLLFIGGIGTAGATAIAALVLIVSTPMLSGDMKTTQSREPSRPHIQAETRTMASGMPQQRYEEKKPGANYGRTSSMDNLAQNALNNSKDFNDNPYFAQSQGGESIKSVLPVALPMPSYEHSLTVSRDLITQSRPFKPVLIYCSQKLLRLLSILWLTCFVAFIVLIRKDLIELKNRAVSFLRTKNENA